MTHSNKTIASLALSTYCTKIVPANLFNVNKRNTRNRCEICAKLLIKTLEQRHWRHSGVFIVNSEHIPHLFLVFQLLILNKYMLAGIIKLRNHLRYFRRVWIFQCCPDLWFVFVNTIANKIKTTSICNQEEFILRILLNLVFNIG